ncbi:hypothetical protein AHAS_Ahas15G0251400 [Arachis hypogaea]
MDLEDQDLLLEDDEVEQDYTYFLRQYLEEEDRLEDDDGDGVVHLAEPSLHTYLGEIEDTRHRTAFLDGNSVVNLSRFRLQGSLLNGVQVTAQNPEKGGTFVTNRERERPLSLKDIRSLIIILRQPTLQAENGAISDRTPECWKDFPCILSYDPNLRLALWPSAEAA